MPLSAVRIHAVALPAKRDLLAAEARLVADHAAGASLALQAVAHGDARWFALNGKVKLAAAAGGASGGHGSVPWAGEMGGGSKRCTTRLSAKPKADIRRRTALALLLAAVTLGLVGLILIAADATECEHRKW